MQIRVRQDTVEIEGYVNAIERKSKPIRSRIGGTFVERICKGAFQRAIDRNENIRVLLNHDWNRDLGGTKDGTLELTEDAIGLRARAIIADKEVIDKARKGDLVGWSFGFSDIDVDRHDENGMMTRDVKDLDLKEVSILDRRRNPAYDGTLIFARADEVDFYGEEFIDDVAVEDEQPEIEEQVEEVREETQPEQPEEVEATIDYSEYEAMISEMKGEKHE